MPWSVKEKPYDRVAFSLICVNLHPIPSPLDVCLCFSSGLEQAAPQKSGTHYVILKELHNVTKCWKRKQGSRWHPGAHEHNLIALLLWQYDFSFVLWTDALSWRTGRYLEPCRGKATVLPVSLHINVDLGRVVDVSYKHLTLPTKSLV